MFKEFRDSTVIRSTQTLDSQLARATCKGVQKVLAGFVQSSFSALASGVLKYPLKHKP